MSHKSEQTKQGSKTYSTDQENKGSKVFNKYLGSNVCVEGGRGGGGKGGRGGGRGFYVKQTTEFSMLWKYDPLK